MNDVAMRTNRAPAAAPDPAFLFGRERRMHARVYEYWRMLLRGRAMPTRAEFEADALGPVARHAILIDLDRREGPGVAACGEALRAQAGFAATPPTIADVPACSLLARLLLHLPAIAAARAPIGFEAEHEDRPGECARYRGVLLPLAAADGTMVAIYGVMTWTAVACTGDAADAAAAVDGAFAAAPAPRHLAPWARESPERAPSPPTPAQLWAAAQTWAELAATDRTHGATPLNAAIGATYDFVLASGADGGTAPSPAEIAARVFAAAWTRHDRVTIARTLRHARKLGLGRGMLTLMLDRLPEGHLQMARADREGRRRARRGGALPVDVAKRDIALMALDPDFLGLIGSLPRRLPAAEMRQAA